MSDVDLSKLKCRVFDYGLFTGMAQALGPLNDGYGEVEFFKPWTDAFCEPSPRYVGRGLSGIKRIYEFFDDMDSVDDWVFFDVGDADIQQMLRSQGRHVFGTGGRPKLVDGKWKPGKASSELEIDRLLFKKTLIKHGLAVPRWKVIIGVDELRTMAQDMPAPFNEGFWVKPNVGERKVFETFFVDKYAKVATKIDDIGSKLKVARATTEFMIEASISGIEPGSDYFISAGVPFETGIYGWEKKGDGYSCKVYKLSDMPSPVNKVNTAMLPVYKEYMIDGMVSTEVRVGPSRIPHYIDGCFRSGNPPGGSISSIYKNFPQIIHAVARGETVNPVFRAKYASELSIDSSCAGSGETPFEFSDNDWLTVKLRTACCVDGQYKHIPFEAYGATVAKAVGLGETQEEAEAAALEVAEKFKVEGKTYNKTTFKELREDIEEGRKYGLSGAL